MLDVDTIARAVRAYVVAERSDICVVYLFGSRARGTARPDSDVDLGVLFRTPRPRTLLGLPSSLEAALADRLDATVQVVDLERAPADLVHRVLRDGHLVVDTDPSRRIRFEVERRNEYFDLLPFLQRYRRVAP